MNSAPSMRRKGETLGRNRKRIAERARMRAGTGRKEEKEERAEKEMRRKKES